MSYFIKKRTYSLKSKLIMFMVLWTAVILFLGACMKPPHLSLVTEYMEVGSLYSLIHSKTQKTKLHWKRRLKMLRDICR
jgi:hypothetical protein